MSSKASPVSTMTVIAILAGATYIIAGIQLFQGKTEEAIFAVLSSIFLQMWCLLVLEMWRERRSRP